MKRKFLTSLSVVIIILLLSLKFLTGKFILIELKNLNENSNINIKAEDVNFSFPITLNFNELKIADKERPYLNINFDKLKTYLSLKDLLTLVGSIKGEADLYDGKANFNIWRNIRGEDIRADVDLTKVNISKHSFLSNFPISGGYLDLKAFNLKFDKEFNLHYLGGDINIKNFKIENSYNLSANITGLPLDIEIPQIHLTKISSLYKLKEQNLFLNNFVINSDLLNVSSDACEINLNNTNFNNCIIKFNFTPIGLKRLASWILLLSGNKINDTKEYSIKIQGKNINYL